MSSLYAKKNCHYLFQGNLYWKFDPSKRNKVSNAYPRDIENWHLPSDIDAAVQWSNKITYFYQNENYWKFNDKHFNIDTSKVPYPRPAGIWWFGCPKQDFSVRDEDGDVIDLVPDVNKLSKNETESNFDYVLDNLIEDVLPPDE